MSTTQSTRGKKGGMTVKELKERCKELGVTFTSKDLKADLINKLAAFEGADSADTSSQSAIGTLAHIPGVAPPASTVPSFPLVGTTPSSLPATVINMANGLNVTMPPLGKDWFSAPVTNPAVSVNLSSTTKKGSRGPTVAELKQQCASLGIKVPSKAKKADIEALLAGRENGTPGAETPIPTSSTDEKPPRKAPVRDGPTLAQLKEECKSLGITGYSSKTKAVIISMINAHKGIVDTGDSPSTTNVVHTGIPSLNILPNKDGPVPAIPSAALRSLPPLQSFGVSSSSSSSSSIPSIPSIPSLPSLPSSLPTIPSLPSSQYLQTIPSASTTSIPTLDAEDESDDYESDSNE